MTRLAAVLLLAASAARAESDLVRALEDEMGRTVARLEMQGRGRPYFVSYTVRASSSVTMSASFGAAKEPDFDRRRDLRVDLRLGGPAFDNSLYVGNDYWRFEPFRAGLPEEDDYDALRFSVWSVTDQAYKQAVQKLSEKAAFRAARMMTDQTPDLSAEDVASHDLPQEPFAFDEKEWRRTLREVSAVFKRYPAVHSSWAWLNFQEVRVVTVDSEGRRFSRPGPNDCRVMLGAYGQAKDGLPVGDSVGFLRPSPAQMPSREALLAEAERLAKEVTALVDAPTMDSYLGPVLFEGQAAAELFNQLLTRNVSSPRAPWFEDEDRKKDFDGGGLVGRLGKRVTSPSVSVVDDPLLAEAEGVPLAGHYRVDDEGIPARAVTLVEKGTLKDVLMSRAPIKERARSNGHGRGIWDWTSGRPGNVLVSVEGAVPLAELKAQLRRRAAEYGLDHAVIVREIGEEGDKEDSAVLAHPVRLARIRVSDGREEPLRNAEFSGVTLRALRDVAGASAERYVHNFYHKGPYKHASSWVMSSVVAPSVLVAEMELVKTKKKPEKLPYLRHPHFARK